jgi:hypothetical protein
MYFASFLQMSRYKVNAELHAKCVVLGYFYYTLFGKWYLLEAD